MIPTRRPASVPHAPLQLPRPLGIRGPVRVRGAHPEVMVGAPAAGARVRTLFPDRRAEAMTYYRKHGYYPIMHLFAISQKLAEDQPWLPRAVMDIWEDSKAQARAYYEDPGYATLAFARNDIEAQVAAQGHDPRPYGIAAKRTNLERVNGN